MKENFPDRSHQPKAALINDFSSFGRCSLAAALPLLSALKVQCCPVPTAIFTNHTGFRHFSWCDFTDRLQSYIKDWKATGLEFSAIASGFLSSMEQLDFVERFVQEFRRPQTIVLVDPVMGDYGKLYRTFRSDVAQALRRLLKLADVLTPNLTEACILADRRYDENMSDDDIFSLAEQLCSLNARACVVSGVIRGGEMTNFIYSREHGRSTVSVRRIGNDRSGTGDVFSAVILGSLVNGMNLKSAVEKAAAFVEASVRRAVELSIPPTDGLPFEETLSMLWS